VTRHWARLVPDLRASSDLEFTLAFQLNALGLPAGKPEHQFWPGRKFRFDLAWPDIKVACEIEGGTWAGASRHTRPAGYERDCIKYSEAAILGWLVVRVTGHMVEDGRAVDLVARALAARAEGVR